MDIHQEINKKLDCFISSNQVPNLLFYGPEGAGKRTLLLEFMRRIYRDDENSKNMIMYVECGHGKGIKFIRDEVNYFAKTNCNERKFKSIVLFNADKLTMDAQSALRRSIEIFSKTTRFFIVLQNKDRLLNPLLSRFCELFIPLPIINDKKTNLHDYFKSDVLLDVEKNKQRLLKAEMRKFEKLEYSEHQFINQSEKLYGMGINGIDVIEYFKNINVGENVLLALTKMTCNIRCERLLMFSMFALVYLRSDETIKNILEM